MEGRLVRGRMELSWSIGEATKVIDKMLCLCALYVFLFLVKVSFLFRASVEQEDNQNEFIGFFVSAVVNNSFLLLFSRYLCHFVILRFVLLIFPGKGRGQGGDMCVFQELKSKCFCVPVISFWNFNFFIFATACSRFVSRICDDKAQISVNTGRTGCLAIFNTYIAYSHTRTCN